LRHPFIEIQMAFFFPSSGQAEFPANLYHNKKGFPDRQRE
jgi:hypothetical protein